VARARKESPDQWRSSPRPADWWKIQPAILERDGHQCTWLVGYDDGLLKDPQGGRITPPGSTTPPGVVLTHPARCLRPATQVDHISHPDAHDDLRSLCTPHHQHRTGRQASQARWARTAKRARPTPKHPGLK
jgi:hypothetical protein